MQKTTPIRIYGETHDSENADKLWQRLLKEADANKTRLLLEAIQSEANSDTILKRDLLSELVSNVSDGLMSNVFGIDGEFLKTIDILGASYLILRDENALGSHMLRVLAGTFAEPSVKLSLLTTPIANTELDQLRNGLSKIESVEDLKKAITEAPLAKLKELLLILHSRAILSGQKISTDVHSTSVIKYSKSGEDYLLEGMQFRDRHMAQQIRTIACGGPSTNSVAVIVGQYHLDGLKLLLPKLMPGYKFEFINIDPYLHPNDFPPHN